MMPVISLVTGTRNRPAALDRLLHSIVLHTTIPYEVIIGDASDEALAKLPTDHSGIFRVFRESPPLGHTRGYNRCFREARGEWILWLNDDAEVTPGYAENAVRFMEAHPQIGLGALPYSENGGPFHVNGAWKAMYANFGIFKKSLGEQVGFFDEELEMYGADNSLAIRILLAGYGIAEIRDAKILHHSVNDTVRQQNQINRRRDNDILTEKYMPIRDEWLATYFRYRQPGDEPWHHGIPPAHLSIR